jgi:hypothetical protein
MLIKNHEIVVRYSFLFDHDAEFTEIFIRDEFD